MRAILTYHSIDASGSVISIDEATFRRHADWLAAGHVRVVSMPEMLSLENGADAIALTFDDAFANFADTAWPILRDRGLPATLFVVTGRVGTDNAWGDLDQPGVPRLPLMDWDSIGTAREQGVDIGSHTRTHRRLMDLGPAALEDEIEGSASLIAQRLGARPMGFAYPYGAHGPGSEAVVRGAYRWACTTELATLRAGGSPHRLPRLEAYYYRRPGALESWGTSGFGRRIAITRLARRTRRWLVPASR